MKALAVPVLAHRLILTPDAMLREETVDQIVDRVLTRVKVPVGSASRGNGSSADEGKAPKRGRRKAGTRR